MARTVAAAVIQVNLSSESESPSRDVGPPASRLPPSKSSMPRIRPRRIIIMGHTQCRLRLTRTEAAVRASAVGQWRH